jgi:hypothetical protein
MHDQTHWVTRLAVHLPEMQTVTFQPDRINQAIEKAEHRDSTLMAYFDLNSRDPEARQYKYYEIPEHYVFNDQSKWVKRKTGHEKVIGRMHGVSIRDTERYFLRLLLLNVTGAVSFDDLLTYEGTLYPSYYESAKARGLTESDEMWDNTLTDAACAAMPRQLRELFAYICVFGESPDMTNL